MFTITNVLLMGLIIQITMIVYFLAEILKALR